jgi:pimeloyl-ACP methyl ester carboxylesterase
VRYIKTGTGPNLVLLHTLRTQLDIFQGVVPQLARQFTVYAYDYPGHGWSDIPEASYAPEDFYQWTAAFLDKLDIKQATVAGVSIGATIALVLAARNNPRVARVVAVNSYDYGPAAGGVRNSSLTARLVLTFSEVPIVGATFMRLRNRLVLDRILRGGLAAPNTQSEAFAKEFYEVGNRPGQYQGFLNLLAHERLWSDARKEYPAIKVPVLLAYGDDDWAPPAARERTRSAIPGVVTESVANGNHFLPLDRPEELQRLIVGFAAN